jgi:hypothetical protein
MAVKIAIKAKTTGLDIEKRRRIVYAFRGIASLIENEPYTRNGIWDTFCGKFTLVKNTSAV